MTDRTAASHDTPLRDGTVYLCRASGEGSHDFRVCVTDQDVAKFYEEMFGKDQDDTLDSFWRSWNDPDEWCGEEGARSLRWELYCARFEVWTTDPDQLALSTPSESTAIVAPQLDESHALAEIIECGRLSIRWLTGPEEQGERDLTDAEEELICKALRGVAPSAGGTMTPVAWRWRRVNGGSGRHWAYGDERPAGPGIGDCEVEPLFAQSATGEWIACSERMPVLPSDSTSAARVLAWVVKDDMGWPAIRFYRRPEWAGTHPEWWCNGDAVTGETITHWMPLPSAPADRSIDHG